MPRFGQGKPMDVQARAVLKASLSLTSRHDAKTAAGLTDSRSTGQIHSVRTFNAYAKALELAGAWAREASGLRHLRALTHELAQAYLAERAAAGIGQKQLDTDRNALGFVVGHGNLEREHALERPAPGGRGYTEAQVALVTAHQSERNALATELAYRAGLRAHELLTIQRADEARPAAHRAWSDARFSGREGVRYVVTGKGGLKREVLFPAGLAARLETRRLATPATVRDRGVNYRSHYDVAGGNAWSKSFGDASRRALGWSAGAHGLRHTYAQQRMDELQGRGIDYYRAREIVSQELGHFRGEIVEVYLR